MTDAATAPTTVSDRLTDAPFEPVVGAHLEHSAEPQDVRWTFAPFDVAAAWTKSWVDWATNAVRRGSTPLGVLADAQRFWSVATERNQPAWSTPFQVVRGWPVARLLDFSTEPGSDVVPTVFLPPQAGHASTIVDHAPGQSQVATALEEGLTRLFVVDWLGATTATKDTTVEDYVKVLDETIAQLGGRANLVGDCQGGWLATIYAALRPESVASLTIGAAPIDFHAGDGAIHEWVDSMGSEEDPMLGYRLLVEANGGVHRGELQVNGFKMMEPAGELTRLADLWANVGDPEHVERYRRFVSWFETPQDMPGAFYLWTVEHLFLNNELVAGTLQVGDETVDLGRITMPVHLLAGTSDHITPPAQVWALAKHVSTPPEDVVSHFVEAGHLGLFMGRRALKEHWAPLFRSVREKTAAAPAESKQAPERASAPKAPAATKPAAKATAKKATAKKATPKKDTAKKAPAKATPAAKTPPVKTTPAKTTPAKTTPAAKGAPATKAAPARSATVAKTAPAKTAPVAKSTSAPAAKTSPAPAEATSVAKTTQAEKPTPATTTPDAKTPAAPAKSAPVTKAATAKATPAPAKAKTAAKATPAKTAPVAKATPAKTAPVAKATPAKTGPVAKATPAKTGPVAKAAPAKTGPAAKSTTAPAKSDPSPKAAPARTTPAAKTASVAPAAKEAPATGGPATTSAPVQTEVAAEKASAPSTSPMPKATTANDPAAESAPATTTAAKLSPAKKDSTPEQA